MICLLAFLNVSQAFNYFMHFNHIFLRTNIRQHCPKGIRNFLPFPHITVKLLCEEFFFQSSGNLQLITCSMDNQEKLPPQTMSLAHVCSLLAVFLCRMSSLLCEVPPLLSPTPQDPAQTPELSRESSDHPLKNLSSHHLCHSHCI